MASTTSAAAPTVPTEVVVTLQKLLTNVLAGFAVATIIYGISVLQVFNYFRRFKHDHWWMKTMVAVLWILDTLTTAMVWHSLYTYLVTNLGNPLADIGISWSFALENGLVTAVVLITHCYYAHQVWTVSKNLYITILVLLCAFGSAAIGIVITNEIFSNLSLLALTTDSFKVKAILVQALASVADIVITAALCVCLRNMKTGFTGTEELVHTVMVYAISRGVLTTIAQIMFLVLFATRGTSFEWQAFHQALAKLYVNSVLMTLNLRNSLRKQVKGVSLSQMSASQHTTMNNPRGYEDDAWGGQKDIERAQTSVSTPQAKLQVWVQSEQSRQISHAM
ncbi:hypothetical protein DL96DRAFT_1607829 [Flagelloscypha sp. PMI_526]|nr:hypothetical protein DL96DRAFT_1607829 [Flagelloscypha sp. PMI_526]